MENKQNKNPSTQDICATGMTFNEWGRNSTLQISEAGSAPPTPPTHLPSDDGSDRPAQPGLCELSLPGVVPPERLRHFLSGCALSEALPCFESAEKPYFAQNHWRYSRASLCRKHAYVSTIRNQRPARRSSSHTHEAGAQGGAVRKREIPFRLSSGSCVPSLGRPEASGGTPFF